MAVKLTKLAKLQDQLIVSIDGVGYNLLGEEITKEINGSKNDVPTTKVYLAAKQEQFERLIEKGGDWGKWFTITKDRKKKTKDIESEG